MSGYKKTPQLVKVAASVGRQVSVGRGDGGADTLRRVLDTVGAVMVVKNPVHVDRGVMLAVGVVVSDTAIGAEDIGDAITVVADIETSEAGRVGLAVINAFVVIHGILLG